MKRVAEGRAAVFLLEIGTEEIPARMIPGALQDLASAVHDQAVAAGLAPADRFTREGNIETFATPRRLAVRVTGLRSRQADGAVEVTGPPARAAYDAEGRPTKAAVGFARAQGVALEDLRRIATPRGECVAVLRQVGGRPAREVLAEVIPPLVASLTFPKTMRWGSGEHRFVRPVHSVVALLDGEVVDLALAGVRAGRDTFGHRFAGKPRVPLQDPGAYLEALRANHVLADIGERRRVIAEGLRSAARAAGARLATPLGAAPRDAGDIDADLLEEVTHLVEWPLVIAGEFEAPFLDLPREILVTAMRHHQKYFALVDRSGGLLNRFLAVANCESDRAGAIRKGNEWVLRARLADARFFWEDDRRTPLGGRVAGLERVAFHEKLGSYAAKVRRQARLAEAIHPAFAAAGEAVDAQVVARAAALCKNDLTTLMVKEFPELEGIVGGLYARADGLPERLADAIYGHYLPRGTDDPVPASAEAAVLGLADRLDTQAGFFLLGVVPTGSRDPYALRRSVQGACRILIEKGVSLSLPRCLDLALEGYGGGARAALLDFYRARQQHLGESVPLRPDSVQAALAASADDPHDARLRMAALDAMRSEPGFEALVLAHKRIKNILQGQPEGTFDPKRLVEGAEKDLHRALEETHRGIEAAGRRDPLGSLRAIARLAPFLDRFFAEVMVMAEDRSLRENRLALLRSIAGLFLRVGDFSEIILAGDPAATARERRKG
ncbi:MAG: glycine--tRNA ligase subunit beta [Acidobacteria bacterium]|nr:MAG: glycine--tRNA ligase subunit beta [Acidobacteriota bacterium]